MSIKIIKPGVGVQSIAPAPMQFKTFTEKAKYLKALKNEQRDKQYDHDHPVEHRTTHADEQMRAIEYFFANRSMV